MCSTLSFIPPGNGKEKKNTRALMPEKELKQGFCEGNRHNEATLFKSFAAGSSCKISCSTALESRPCSCGAAALQLGIQYSVLSLLPSLKVVASGGVDHLRVEGDPHAWCSQLRHSSYCHGSASGVGTEDCRLLRGTMSKGPELKPVTTVS